MSAARFYDHRLNPWVGGPEDIELHQRVQTDEGVVRYAMEKDKEQLAMGMTNSGANTESTERSTCAEVDSCDKHSLPASDDADDAGDQAPSVVGN